MDISHKVIFYTPAWWWQIYTFGSGKNILNGGKNMLKRGKNILNDGKCELDLDYILELQKPGQKGRTGLESVCNLLFAVREQTCLVHLRVSRPNKCFSDK